MAYSQLFEDQDVHHVTPGPEPYRERVATTPFTPMERFFYSNGGSWSLSKVPGSSSKHMQRHRDAAEQTVCDALLKG